jgi:sigma-B regulation protein RsbU (phosphoserine phosphatase)
MPGEIWGEGDGQAGLGASLGTLLDRLAGYGGLLTQEARDENDEELCGLYGRIGAAALELKGKARPYCLPPAERGALAEERDRLESGVYGILYDIIALIHTARRKIGAEGKDAFLPDTESLLEAANAIVERFEEELGSRSGDSPAGQGPRFDGVALPPAPQSGRILVVDDELINRELLSRHLERQGHLVCQAPGGKEALALLREAPFDIVILDVMMPGMNGYQLLERIKSDEKLGDLYVIVISALEDTESIARCIQLGAEDYLPRNFEPVILKARIESCLEKKSLRAKEELYVAAVLETERRLRAELQEGAAYVRGLLPPRIDREGLKTDWLFVPSLSLGGDVFGYHAIEGGRLAIYLIDVSGHGIEAALFSVTLMNLLKSQVLPSTDFGDPASVLRRLNESFRMEEQNNLYFTAWYGVWEPASGELRYASAGSPPAVLVSPEGEVTRLETGGPAVGIDSGSSYEAKSSRPRRGSRLSLFSDGIYEVRTREGGILGLDAFIGLLASSVPRGKRLDLSSLLRLVRSLSADERFDDDVSIVELCLG